MSSATIHINPGATRVTATIIEHAAHTSPSRYEYPAHVAAHVEVDDVRLTMSPEQALLLRDALTAALDVGPVSP